MQYRPHCHGETLNKLFASARGERAPKGALKIERLGSRFARLAVSSSAVSARHRPHGCSPCTTARRSSTSATSPMWCGRRTRLWPV